MTPLQQGAMSWMQSIPVVWAVLGALGGAILTGIVWILVQRRYGNALTKASENLVKITESQVSALENTLKLQKDHYESEAAETKRKYEKDIDEWKARSDLAEKTLHDKRNIWNAEKLQLSNENATLRERPDLGTIKALVESEITQLSGIGSTIAAIAESLKGHAGSDAATFASIERALSQTVDLQKKILDAITAHDGKADGLKSELIAALTARRTRKTRSG